MCLAVLAWRVLPDHPLLLVANRDEHHTRPTAPMHWWPAPRLLGGRDLEAGGTWLGVAAGGRFGLITNLRDAPVPPGAPSRGGLIPRFLAGGQSAIGFLEDVAREAPRYAGFNLLAGDGAEIAYLTNADRRGPVRLAPGLHGLSNAPMGTPWPKVGRSVDRLAATLDTARSDPEALLEVLADRTELGDAAAADRWLSAPFIVQPRYGTRSTSALLLDAAGAGAALERRYGADGAATGVERFALAG